MTEHTNDTFQVDLRGLVDLLSHHLYSSPRVYVRELLQNGIDAVTQCGTMSWVITSFALPTWLLSTGHFLAFWNAR